MEDGFAPSARGGACRKVPSPAPIRIAALVFKGLHATISNVLSPSKSPAAIAKASKPMADFCGLAKDRPVGLRAAAGGSRAAINIKPRIAAPHLDGRVFI